MVSTQTENKIHTNNTRCHTSVLYIDFTEYTFEALEKKKQRFKNHYIQKKSSSMKTGINSRIQNQLMR